MPVFDKIMNIAIRAGVTNLANYCAALTPEAKVPAREYLRTFRDYSAPYKPHIDKHSELFDSMSMLFASELNLVDTSCTTSARLVYKETDDLAIKIADKYCQAEGFGPEQQDEIKYLTRLAGQFTTRMATFAHDPMGVHQIHKHFTRMNYDSKNPPLGTIPPLGRTPENIVNPGESAGRTRTKDDMKKTLGVEIGDVIKPPKPITTDFITDEEGVTKQVAEQESYRHFR